MNAHSSIVTRLRRKLTELDQWKETTITEKEFEQFRNLGNQYAKEKELLYEGINGGKVAIYKVASTPKPNVVKESDKTDSKRKFTAKKKAHKMHRGAIKTKNSIFAISTPMGNKN